jgi:hypothetical protein
LQGKHKQLLARIPASPSRSLASSPILASPIPVVPAVFHSPSFFDDVRSPSHSPSPSTSSLIGNTKPKRHFRKISVSHDDISSLADQNAELLDKLEKLELEAAQSDLAGRRVLKQLEREISLLRGELELSHAKNAELEGQAREIEEEHSKRIAEELLSKKEAKLEAVMEPSSSSPLLPSRNSMPSFASFQSTSGRFPSSPSIPTATGRLPSSSNSQSSTRSSFSNRHLHSRTISVPEPQLATISQLLLKIQELEGANANIVQQQADTATRLQAMQQETDNMSRMYERLNDSGDVQLELVDESAAAMHAASGAEHGDSEGTVRFQSFRRTLENDRDAPDSFVRESTSYIKGDFSDDSEMSGMHINASRKPRKSVMGLFAPSEEQSISANLSSIPIPFPHESPASSAPGSPTSFSHLSMAPTTHAPGIPTHQTSLGSELGSEYGDDWGANAGNYHLRTTSLYDMSNLQMSPQSALSPGHLPFSNEANTSTSATAGSFETPRKSRILASSGTPQLTIEPPTPEKHSATASKQSLRYRKMSQTVRNRTQRWVDGRFQESMMGLMEEAEKIAAHAQEAPVPVKDEGSARSPMLPEHLTRRVPKRIASAFEIVAEKMKEKLAAPPEQAVPAEQEQRVELFIEHENAPALQENKGVTKYVLEIWLWMQFIVIVLLFLWAMARKGPKSVLGDGSHNRRQPTRAL